MIVPLARTVVVALTYLAIVLMVVITMGVGRLRRPAQRALGGVLAALLVALVVAV